MLALGAAAATPVAAVQGPVDPVRPIRLLEAALAGPVNGLPSASDVRAAVSRTCDMEAIANAVLAGVAPRATANQVERFRQALLDRITRDLLNRRRREGRGMLVIVRARAIGPGEWIVTSLIRIARQNDRPMSWRVAAGRRGALIKDVQGGGSGMVRALRNEYAPAVRRLGLDGLIARMTARSATRR